MKAIILAAGMGKRLRPHTNDKPKSLVHLFSEPLISYTLKNLTSLGIKSIVLVVGYKANLVKEVIGNSFSTSRVHYVENTQFQSTDNLTSLWLAKNYIRNGFILINADVIFDKRLLEKLLKSPHENVSIVQKTDNLPTSSMKVRVDKQEEIIRVGRDLQNANARAIGFYKFSANGAKNYFAEIEKVVRSPGKHQIEKPLAKFLEKNTLHALSVGRIAWAEIDDEQDLKEAAVTMESALKR